MRWLQIWPPETRRCRCSASRLLLSGLFMLLIEISIICAKDSQCSQKIWDEPHEGRAVKRMDFPCQAGSVEWTGPYGGLFINIQGPKKDHQLCLQASAYHSSGVVSILDESENPRQLVKLVETRDTERPIRHTVCLSAHGDTLLFVEADIDALVSSKIIVEYDVETNPRYGDDACRPCTDEELLYHYCSSDFVGIGRMLDLKQNSAVNIIPVSLDLVKRQSTKYFTKDPYNANKLTGQLYTPSQCKMQYGQGKFIFMGKMKFNRMHLRCAPTYEDFQELQRTSKLKGTALCT